MKTLKISNTAHKELKLFSAKAEYNMEVIASEAIIRFVKDKSALEKISSKIKSKTK